MCEREVNTPGSSECCGWAFWRLHCSCLSLYPLADAGKADFTYSANSNDIQKAYFPVLRLKKTEALKLAGKLILAEVQRHG